MGADDRDEGADGCVEHDYKPTGLTLAGDGAYLEHACTRCGSLSLQTPDQISGSTP